MLKQHIREKRSMAWGKSRFFYTPKDMAEAKLDEMISRARANREGKKIEGVTQIHCGCGGEGCWITSHVEANKPEPEPIKRIRKKQMKNKYIILPSGKIKYLFIKKEKEESTYNPYKQAAMITRHIYENYCN